jgi:CDP-glycerol glycerophosphotransferase (TagB/SpsB family)
VLVGLFIFRKTRRRFFENFRRKMIHELFEVMLRSSDTQFIIKVKNKVDDNKGIFEKWILQNRLDHRIKVVANYDPLKLIIASDVLITHKSTFAVDGLAMSKPVILFHDSTSQNLEEFRKLGAFYHAESKEELETLVLKLGQEKAAQDPKILNAQKESLNYGKETPEAIISRHLIRKENNTRSEGKECQPKK